MKGNRKKIRYKLNLLMVNIALIIFDNFLLLMQLFYLYTHWLLSSFNKNAVITSPVFLLITPTINGY